MGEVSADVTVLVVQASPLNAGVSGQESRKQGEVGARLARAGTGLAASGALIKLGA